MLRSSPRRLARPLPLIAIAGLSACIESGDGRPPLQDQNRPATTAELVGLVRSRLVDVGMTAMRASKAFEDTKAWSDAEAGRIDCDVASGACAADVESTVDDIIAELFPAESIARTTETETVYARSIELGMSPYPVEWTLSSRAQDQVEISLRLGDEATPAGRLQLSPTGASLEASLGAFQTLIEMSDAMDALEDSDLVERLSGTLRSSLQLNGDRALRASTEVDNLALTVSFMDGASLVYTSAGTLRVSGSQDGDGRNAETAVTLPRSTIVLPARLLQNRYRTRCEQPSDPCQPRATEILTAELYEASFATSGTADSGVFQLNHTGPSGPWITVAADGTQFASAELSSFAMAVQTAVSELLIDVPSQLTAGFDFDVSRLTHIFDVPSDIRRERFSAAFQGRASVRTDDDGRGNTDILRVLEGELSGSAAELGEDLRVSASQCLIALDSPRPGISRDHPFSHLNAGACQN